MHAFKQRLSKNKKSADKYKKDTKFGWEKERVTRVQCSAYFRKNWPDAVNLGN